jgi:hypothetical protein
MKKGDANLLPIETTLKILNLAGRPSGLIFGHKFGQRLAKISGSLHNE